MGGAAMNNSDPDDNSPSWATAADPSQALADAARPLLGSEGFSDERIDELADAFVTSRIGETTEQFVNWALAQGPIGLDPEVGL
jgi:hypothetical protein